jgi:hypothetical protein
MIQVGFIDAIWLNTMVQTMLEVVVKLMCKWRRAVMGMTRLL